MSADVFLAGAAGAIGAHLVPLLIDAGYRVHGTTRSPERAKAPRAAGVAPVVIDIFDQSAVLRAMASIRPEIVIHQLTDLPRGLEASRMSEGVARNARVRKEGTRNLVTAAVTAGARRLIAQSIAWAYAPGPEPHSEEDPLDSEAEGLRAVSVAGVIALEQAVLSSPLEAVVLRYGQLYGPGTRADEPGTTSAPLHVDAAAHAALLAAKRPVIGVYNIADANGYVSTAKARRELGWDPAFRLGVDSHHSVVAG